MRVAARQGAEVGVAAAKVEHAAGQREIDRIEYRLFQRHLGARSVAYRAGAVAPPNSARTQENPGSGVGIRPNVR